MREVIEAARRVTGREIPAREEGRRAGRPAAARRRERAGARRAGLDAERATSSEMIADAWAWHQAHPQGYSD